MSVAEFDDIRPYDDEEVGRVVEELIADRVFKPVVKMAFPDLTFKQIKKMMLSCKTKRDFQENFSCPFLWKIVHNCTDGLTLDHSAVEDKTKAYTYVSNHRDIVLDAAFLSILLMKEGMDSVENAVGNNLLFSPWIMNVMKLNKSFIVRRSLNLREVKSEAERLSRYIHHTITDKKQSVWIAHREGRAKDADDRTQESVLKMLAMGGKGDVIDRLMALNIVPMSISYEYDPCDHLKAQEIQFVRDIPNYKKFFINDVNSMLAGIAGYKGHVHIQMAPCLNDELAALDRSLPKAELYRQIALLIDRHIHRNYRMYPCNYMAHDMLLGKEVYPFHYNKEDEYGFDWYIDNQIEKLSMSSKDTPFLRETMLQMYTNLLKNHQAAWEEDGE